MKEIIYQTSNVPEELQDYLVPKLNDVHRIDIVKIISIEKRKSNLTYDYINAKVEITNSFQFNVANTIMTIGVPHFYEKQIDRYFKLNKIKKLLNLTL